MLCLSGIFLLVWTSNLLWHFGQRTLLYNLSWIVLWTVLQVIKEDIARTLKNTNMKPLSHSSYLRLQALCQSFWDVEQKLSLLNDLSLSDLRAFIPDLLSQVWYLNMKILRFHEVFQWLRTFHSYMIFDFLYTIIVLVRFVAFNGLENAFPCWMC